MHNNTSPFLKVACAIISAASVALTGAATLPADSLALRVTEGTSAGRIVFKDVDNHNDSRDYYKVYSSADGKVVIEGNTTISQARGLHRYLREVAGIHICWNSLTAPLPSSLPLPADTLSAICNVPVRYYLNYCTFSYSTPFWDEERWMQEIDWMALHGVNTPLAITGSEKVWDIVLERLGCDNKIREDFIAAPPYIAWWMMNNMENTGTPASKHWIERQSRLQKSILARMRSMGMSPVLPGYCGMLPREAAKKLNLSTADPGKWCGYKRPSFLLPSSTAFDSISDLYYNVLEELYGKSRYYSADPFHEGGNIEGVDLAACGERILAAMKRNASQDAVWVVQAWQENPRDAMIANLPQGEMLVLDLYAETKPQWGDSASVWHRQNGFGHHDWAYCMLLNFGGNIGMHGRLDKLRDGYAQALSASPTLRGIGATAEGIENNPVMYEALFDMPWTGEPGATGFDIKEYLKYRYGMDECPDALMEAWHALLATVYNAPADYKGEGTVESIICARPAWKLKGASTWGNANLFYPADSTAKAAKLYASAITPSLAMNYNFNYDYIDISRQALSDHAYTLYHAIDSLKSEGRISEAKTYIDEFLQTILRIDQLLSNIPEFSTQRWLNDAASAAGTPEERAELVRSAATLITVWGNEAAANAHGLKDYSHRLWHGITGELYYDRWRAFFDYELSEAHDNTAKPDFYTIETDWIEGKVKEYE